MTLIRTCGTIRATCEPIGIGRAHPFWRRRCPRRLRRAAPRDGAFAFVAACVLGRLPMQASRRAMHPPETRQAVIECLRDGLSLRKAAETNGVSPSTVLGWVDADPAYSEQYTQARARGYLLLADEILEISDDSSGDVIDTEHGPRVDAERVARSKLRVDSRKWMLAKMLPKIYGDKLETTHELGDSVTKVIREIVYPRAE